MRYVYQVSLSLQGGNVIKEVFDGSQKNKATFLYASVGPGLVEHNYLCAVCREKPAVLNCSTGILQPCWSCQDDYSLIVKKSKFVKIFNKIKGLF